MSAHHTDRRDEAVFTAPSAVHVPAARPGVPKSLYLLLGILTTFVVGLGVVVLLLIPQHQSRGAETMIAETTTPKSPG